MLELQLFLFFLLVCLLILHYLKQLWSIRHYPSGPLLLPGIGGLWRVATGVSHDTLIKLAKQYGNIYTIWAGPLPLVILSGFQAVKEGLINHSEASAERLETPFLRDALKNRGFVFANGHSLKQQRRFGLITLRKLGLGKKGMEQQIEVEAQQLVETLEHAKGQPLDPSLPITNSVCNVISVLAFGQRFSLEDEDFQKLVKAIYVLSKFGATFFQILYDAVPWLMKYLPGPHKKAFSCVEMARSFAKKEIERHKENQTLHEPQDFIDFYLVQMQKAENDPDSAYNDDNLAQCTIDLFAAGTETTATSLKWALLLMVTHQEIQDKVHKEIEDVFGSSRLICYQDRKKLPYISAVIHEIQRFKYIFFYGLARQTTKDVNMCGVHIPKGTIIVPDLRSVLLDSEHWETPEEFNPNHFLDKDGEFVAREEFLAFGAGARACIGEQLARIELFIFFTSLMRAFTFQLPAGVKELRQDPVMGIVTPPQPYKLCAIPQCTI
ncbi:cytochrome P450 2J2-like [Hemicordylus capensis]|uniref:cytochrome P450 2J2-like n=1 Tax=Hemicordylus capensis TaxID=884348 RepID=UPI002304A4C3|nr:cytochrome P450 2J2-like [Hemicordylus capensis]